MIVSVLYCSILNTTEQLEYYKKKDKQLRINIFLNVDDFRLFYTLRSTASALKMTSVNIISEKNIVRYALDFSKESSIRGIFLMLSVINILIHKIFYLLNATEKQAELVILFYLLFL